MNAPDLPVAVIGAGPVGLAAASHLLASGQEPIVFEAGPGPGAAITEWAHVRLFSPWEFNIDKAAADLLAEAGWTPPPAGEFPTGGELVESYLAPLAAVDSMARCIRFDTRVVAISRVGLDKAKTAGRGESPFRVRVIGPDGEADVLARAVIDASGTWSRPGPAGAGGVAALGEHAATGHLSYRIPDLSGPDRQRYANRKVLVVGSGHSAFNALNDLVDLRSDEPMTEITWAVRRAELGQVFGGGENDALAERGRLGARIRSLIESGEITVRLGAHIERFDTSPDGLVNVISRGEKIAEVDEVVVVTGFRPDLSILSELRLDLDPALEAPSALAPLIDPNQHSCGTVRPHGAEELQHRDEPGLYIVGMKSYGRAPTALMLTGYEQVRSVVAALTGDWEAARDVHLVLPETGVCSLDSRPTAEPELHGACCG